MSDTPDSSKASLDHATLVESLAEIAQRKDLSEIQYQVGDIKIRVSRHMTSQPAVMQAMPAPQPLAAAAMVPVLQTSLEAEHPGTVKSPMVGSAYLRPAPESPPFVEVGSTVKAGDKILLVEAMKTFNEIIAPRSGTVTQILVEDGEPVEYGQALFVIE